MSTTRGNGTAGLLQLDVCLVCAGPEPGLLLDHLSSTLVAGVRLSTATSLDAVEADVIWLEGAGESGPAARLAVLQAAERGALVIVHAAMQSHSRSIRVSSNEHLRRTEGTCLAT